MKQGILSQREQDVLRTLLAQKGINTYELYDLTGEGHSLPGSSDPLEIALSGQIGFTPILVC